MVRREVDTVDRRRMLVHLTPKGAETLRKAWPICEDAIAGRFRALTEEERGALLSILRKLSAGIS